MKKRVVHVNYLKHTDQFRYVNVSIGGIRYVKNEIAVLIKKKLPFRCKKTVHHIDIQRPGEIITYAVVVVA